MKDTSIEVWRLQAYPAPMSSIVVRSVDLAFGQCLELDPAALSFRALYTSLISVVW